MSRISCDAKGGSDGVRPSPCSLLAGSLSFMQSTILNALLRLKSSMKPTISSPVFLFLLNMS